MKWKICIFFFWNYISKGSLLMKNLQYFLFFCLKTFKSLNFISQYYDKYDYNMCMCLKEWIEMWRSLFLLIYLKGGFTEYLFFRYMVFPYVHSNDLEYLNFLGPQSAQRVYNKRKEYNCVQFCPSKWSYLWTGASAVTYHRSFLRT